MINEDFEIEFYTHIIYGPDWMTITSQVIKTNEMLPD